MRIGLQHSYLTGRDHQPHRHHDPQQRLLQLPEGGDAQAFCRRAAEVGLRLQPVSQFCHQAHHPGAVVLGYTALTLAQIKYHVRQLAQL
ncbi:hypothetical protein [Pseudomonas sp. TE3610]